MVYGSPVDCRRRLMIEEQYPLILKIMMAHGDYSRAFNIDGSPPCGVLSKRGRCLNKLMISMAIGPRGLSCDHVIGIPGLFHHDGVSEISRYKTI